MRAWLSYAAASAGVAVVLAAAASTFLTELGSRAVWYAGGIAWVVQLAAFGLLVVGRRSGRHFLAGWAAGMLLRFGALAAVAFVGSRTGGLPLDALLVGLVGVMFVLLLIEPLFLRLETRAS